MDAPTLVLDAVTVKTLLNRLAYLAGYWRETKSEAVAERYRAVLLTLLELGYREWLHVESELPDELMPPEYETLIREADALKPPLPPRKS